MAYPNEPAVRPQRGFRLDPVDGKIGGVCAGIGNHFGVDTTMVRIAFVAGTLLGFGSLLVVYLAIWLIAN